MTHPLPLSQPASATDRNAPRLAATPREPRHAGAPEDAMARLESLFGNPRRLARRDVLYRTGDPFSALHLVRVGSLKSVALVDDGREQITAYSLAGDIVGLDGLGVATHRCDVVALEDSEVSQLPFARIDEAARDPVALQALFEVMASDLRRGQELTVLLGSLRAEKRVAIFLLDLAQRLGMRGYSASELVLRMTREEIASFLGLKLETVSRILSHLHAEGLIDVQGRAVRILDGPGLRELDGASFPAGERGRPAKKPLT